SHLLYQFEMRHDRVLFVGAGTGDREPGTSGITGPGPVAVLALLVVCVSLCVVASCIASPTHSFTLPRSPLPGSRSLSSELPPVPFLQPAEETADAPGGQHRAARMLDLAAHQQQPDAGGVHR